MNNLKVMKLVTRESEESMEKQLAGKDVKFITADVGFVLVFYDEKY